MKRELITRTSSALGKDMSLIAYGEGGQPVIAFQAQNSKCNAFEDFGMVDALSDYIESGSIQLFSVDNNDEESWSDTSGDKAWRAERQEAFFRHVTDELVPLVHELASTDRRPLAVGCSMGATHAALVALRRPDLFQGCIALSGVYDARYFFGDWMDATLYENSVVSFLPNMPADHPYVSLYGKRQLVFCVGQGAWEDQGIADLRIIADACHDKGIDAWCDFWGYDVNHDWPWWKKQICYFLPFVLDDMEKTLAERDEATRPARRRAARKATTTVREAAEKVATGAKRTARKTSAGAKRVATKVGGEAEAASDAIAADAERVADSARGAVVEAKAVARRGGTRAKATASRVARKAESQAEKMANDTQAAVDKAKATTRRAASAARKTAAKAEAEAEKVVGEVKQAKARATARRAATEGKGAGQDASD